MVLMKKYIIENMTKYGKVEGVGQKYLIEKSLTLQIC